MKRYIYADITAEKPLISITVLSFFSLFSVNQQNFTQVYVQKNNKTKLHQ